MKNKRGQLTLGDAPQVVIIVGLVFLLLATLAYLGAKFGDAISTDTTTSVVNESIATPTGAGISLAYGKYRNAVCTVTSAYNSSTEAISSGNYTVRSPCVIVNTTGTFTTAQWNITYSVTYDSETIATNITNDMNTEVKNNTSIAGIVLTISLIGIVLTVLLGIFVIARNRGM